MKVEINGHELEYKTEVNRSGERHVVITRGSEVKGDLEIPAEIDACPVTVIGDGAFSGCGGLTGVWIPDSVTNIKASAFWGCVGLKEVVLPRSVTKIGAWAFMGCSGLTRMEIPDGVTEIESHTFAACSALTSMKMPDSVTKIGDSAFAGCTGLQRMTLSGGVTEIEREAFKGCIGLTSITIPDQVKGIGQAAFADCDSLLAFKVATGNRFYKSISGLVLSRDGLTLMAVPAGLKSVTIPEGVEVIGQWSFSGCSRLTRVTIPDGVTVIGEGAFSGCSGLVGVTIPDGVTSIGAGAFSGCSGLVGVTIPNGVTSIGDGAFSGCSGLAGITIPASVTDIGEEVFKDCRQLPSIMFSTKFGSRYMALSGHELACTLIHHPELAEKYDFGLLQGDDWAYLLSARPEFADKCMLWGMLNDDDWAALLKHQPQLANNRLDCHCAEMEIWTNRRAHGVSRYRDVAEIEYRLKKSIPVVKQLDLECFLLGPAGTRDFDLTYIDGCKIQFKNEDGTSGCVEINCHLTESGPLLVCDPQINVVRTGGWKKPCRRAGRTVPVAYARELPPRKRTFKIKGAFDPRRLTVVVEDGFLRCIRYCGCAVTEFLYHEDFDVWAFSIVYWYPDGGKVSFGNQYIDCY